MHELPWTKFSTEAVGLKKSSDWVREYREEILKWREARNRAGPREGFDAIANHWRQTGKLARRDELFLATAETGNSEYARKAYGKSGRNQVNNLWIYTAHKILTHGGGPRREVTNREAAKLMVKILPPEMQKEFSVDRIISIRKEMDRRCGSKARKLKKQDEDRDANRYFPSIDFVKENCEIVDEEIEKCKNDPGALLVLAALAIDRIITGPKNPAA
jgi:hypothetical protein